MKLIFSGIMVLMLSGCASSLLNKTWEVQKEYCQSAGTNHAARGDKFETSSRKRKFVNTRGQDERWKLTFDKYDPWERVLWGRANVKSSPSPSHEECVKVSPITVVNGKKGIEVFLRTRPPGASCEALITPAFEAAVRTGTCGGAHSGGWVAY